MTSEDMVHVAYLGAFTVSGLLYRADLFLDEDGYVAEQTVTSEDGKWIGALYRVAPADADAPIETAVLRIMERLLGAGVDVASINVIHSAQAVPVTEPLLH